ENAPVAPDTLTTCFGISWPAVSFALSVNVVARVAPLASPAQRSTAAPASTTLAISRCIDTSDPHGGHPVRPRHPLLRPRTTSGLQRRLAIRESARPVLGCISTRGGDQ